MTRFARAKGSKASNERVPNEATPWHVMKEQLRDNAIMKSNRTPKAKSAKELLKENDRPFYHDSTGNVNNEWAEFKIDRGQTNSAKKNEPDKLSQTVTNCEKSKKSCESEEIGETRAADDDTSRSPRKLKKRKKISKSADSGSDSRNLRSASVDDLRSQPAETAKSVEEIPEVGEKLKKPKKRKNVDSPKIENEEKKENPKSESGATGGKVSKRHKRNQKRILKRAEERAKLEKNGTGGAFFDAEGNDWSSNVNFGKPRKIGGSESSTRQDRPVGKNGSNENSGKPSNLADPRNNGAKRKTGKIRDDKEHKRRKPETDSMKCTINGVDVVIVKYDGFPVKQEDAERLRELRKKMIMKGIPKSEIDAAMKLERRKAEKALTRLKKQVCFHCRKAGHNLSDCPELGKEETATGICFKCGSTEHTHFQCRVTKKEEFRFASCFICREQGHIAKQCPDNPKGLYPQGGACKICGDVTHLRKDCPDVTREKEETTITVGTIAENTLESLDDDTAKTIARDDQKSRSKIVKF